jgi:hypothetical protein
MNKNSLSYVYFLKMNQVSIVYNLESYISITNTIPQESYLQTERVLEIKVYVSYLLDGRISH